MPKKKKTNKNKTTKKKTTKKITQKKDVSVNKSSIEKKVKDKDFAFLTQNKLIAGRDDDQLIVLLEDMWENIKRANPDARRYSFSIITLFATVSEMFLLAKDRETRHKQKINLYEERINDYIDDQEDIRNNQEYLRSEISIIKEEADKKGKPLTPRQRIKINNINVKLNELNIQYRDRAAQIRAAKASKQLFMYEVNTAGQVYNDVTTHLLSKNEKVIKLLKEFNLTPSLAPIQPNGAINKPASTSELLGSLLNG